MTTAQDADISHSENLKDVAKLFLKLGCIAFGGPAAHIAMMQDEVVRKRQWMSEEHYLDLIGATNLIPGPNSTEMAIHIGRERAGWKGLIIAGLCFILPAVLMTGCFAWLYKEYGQLPQLQHFIYGIKPAIIAIILAAIIPLARKSLKSIELGFIGLAALVLSLLQFSEVAIMFGAGFLAAFMAFIRRGVGSHYKSLLPLVLPSATISDPSLFFSFLKIGSILYGSGYVLFAFLDTEFVANGLLSRQQLIDAIAVGQFTPGPVFSSVTFIGYQIGGLRGAIVSTIAIFLPAFIFAALPNPLVRIIRRSVLFSAFLDAVNITSVALIIAVGYEMGRESISDWRTVLIALTSLGIVFGFKKLNSALLVLVAALAGYLLSLM